MTFHLVPPVKTEKGWLTLIHAVWKLKKNELYSWAPCRWNKIYTAGAMLLDFDNPANVIGFAKQPVPASTMDYEHKGFRGDAIFPCGLILEDSGELKIYYGSADIVECLATASVDDMLKALP